ncbi:unannotated protein [freshwater metagenome]|uniref:Unannotated protein n=1 Tax=freshwater metagenome TaxID=449393 RepID=A0A6J7K7J2_9ZZZZ
MGHRRDRAHIGRDVLADTAIAPRSRLHEMTVLVADGYRESVDLEFGHERGASCLVAEFGEATIETLTPGLQLLAREHVVETHHGDAVLDR